MNQFRYHEEVLLEEGTVVWKQSSEESSLQKGEGPSSVQGSESSTGQTLRERIRTFVGRVTKSSPKYETLFDNDNGEQSSSSSWSESSKGEEKIKEGEKTELSKDLGKLANRLLPLCILALTVIEAVLSCIKTMVLTVELEIKEYNKNRSRETEAASPLHSPYQLQKTRQNSRSSSAMTSTPDSLGQPVYQTLVRVPLPAPGTQGAPFFNGVDVTEFLRYISLLFDEAGVEEERRPERMIRYCAPTVSIWLRQSPFVQNPEWKKLVRYMKKEFAENDSDQKRQKLEYLEQLCAEPKDKGYNVAHFIHLFEACASRLEKRGQLTNNRKCELFITGLPSYLREKAAEACGIITSEEDEEDDDSPRQYKYDSMRDRILKKVYSQKRVEQLVRPDGMKELVQESTRQPTIGSREDVWQGAIVKPMVPTVAAAPASSLSRPAASIDDLIGEFDKMKIAMMRVTDRLEQGPQTAYPQRNTRQGPMTRTGLDPALNNNVQAVPPPRAYPPIAGLPDKRGDENRTDYNRRTGKCMFCEESGHLVSGCPHIKDLERRGLIHRDARNLICLGTPGTSSSPVSFRNDSMSRLDIVRELLGTDTVAQTAAFRINSVEIVAADTDDEDCSEDETAIYGISAAEVSRSQDVRRSQRDRVLTAKVDKQRRYGTPKSLRKGTYGPTPQVRFDEGDQPSSGPQEAAETEDVEMAVDPGQAPPEARMDARQTGTGLKLSAAVKGKEGAAKIATRMLKTMVWDDFTVEDCLQVKEVHNIIFSGKRWNVGGEGGEVVLVPPTQRKAKSASALHVGSAGLSMEQDSDKDVGLAGRRQLEFHLEIAGRTCLGMFDTGAMVSVISKSLVDDLGLVIHGTKKKEVVGLGGGRQTVLGYIRAAPLRVGKLRLFHTMYVVENVEFKHDFLLGRTFQEETRSATWFDENLNSMMRFFDPDGEGHEDVMEAGGRRVPALGLN